jgi:hypothetical protein
MPHWKVNLPSGSHNSMTQWIAKGDEDFENVVVNWGGFEVGRIRSESGARKHTVGDLCFLLVYAEGS